MAISSRESQAFIAALAWAKKHFENSRNVPNFPTYISGPINASMKARLSGNDLKIEIGPHDTEVSISELTSSTTYAKVDGSYNQLSLQGSGGSYTATDYNDQKTEYRVSVSGTSSVNVGSATFYLS